MEKLFPDFDERLIARPVTGKSGAGIGEGLFAKGSFKAGETVFYLDWSDEERTEILSWDDTEEEHHNRCAAIAPRWYFYINAEHPFWYLNHSCEPNVSFKHWAQSEDDIRIPMVALRDIAPGEELLLDYSLTIADDDGLTDEDDYEMDCLCGSPRCRGKVTSFANLPREIQERELFRREPYYGSISAFVLNDVPELVEQLNKQAPDLYATFVEALASQNRLAEEFEADYDPEEPYYIK